MHSMTVVKRLWILLFTVLSVAVHGEQVYFQNLTTDMGLSHGDVISSLIDSEGYIWAGTVDGLNKYDGTSFTIYKQVAGDSTSLPSNYINCIYEDSHNNLWLGTNGFLVRYNRDKDNFERIPLAYGTAVIEIYEDKTGHLWLGCLYGVYIFDWPSRRLYNPFEGAIPPDLMSTCVSIVEDSKGTRWIAFQRSKGFGLLALDTKNRFKRYGKDVKERKLRSNMLTSLMVDKNDNVWIGYFDGGIDIINTNTGRMRAFEPNTQKDWKRLNVADILQLPDGRIMIGSGNEGLFIYHPQTKSVQQYQPRISDRSLLSNNLTDISVSEDGIALIGCWGGGISLYDKRFNRFRQFRQSPDGLHGNSVTAISEDERGYIWIGTDGGGLNRFDSKKEQFTYFQHQPGKPHSLASDKVLAVLADKAGNLWVGYWLEGLSHYRIQGDDLVLVKHYPLLDPTNSNTHSVYTLAFDHSGHLWVGTFASGAYRQDPVSDRFVSLPESMGDRNYNSTFDIFPDAKGDLWFASDRIGLIRKKADSDSILLYPTEVSDETGTLLPAVNVLFEDSRQRLWAGGDENGLYLINSKMGRFHRYTVEDGLSDNSIQGILEDGEGYLWLSSRVGLTKVRVLPGKNPERPTLKCTHFTIQDGLQGRVFNRWSFFKSSNGELFFGGQNGFNVFLPDSIVPNDVAPPVHLTALLVDNKPVAIDGADGLLTRHISHTENVVFNYRQSSFRLRFIALNYFNPQKNEYAYMLEGFDKDWIHVGNKTEAAYTNLDPGKYVFRVKASNNDGIWNEEGTLLNITILPAWYETLWFKFVLVFAIAFALTLLYWWRVYRFKHRQEMLEKMVDEKTAELRSVNEALVNVVATKDKFFSVMAHDIKNPFNAIMGISDVLVEEYDELNHDMRRELIQHIATSSKSLYQLLENLLTWSRFQRGNLDFNPKPVELRSALDLVIGALLPSAVSKNIALVDKVNSAPVYVRADPPMLDSILRNLINNALKFTPTGGRVEISVEVDTETATICVKDSGIGMTNEQIDRLFRIDSSNSTAGTNNEKGTGLGLILVHDFVTRQGGQITVESRKGEGSTFKVSLPLAKE